VPLPPRPVATEPVKPSAAARRNLPKMAPLPLPVIKAPEVVPAPVPAASATKPAAATAVVKPAQ